MQGERRRAREEGESGRARAHHVLVLEHAVLLDGVVEAAEDEAEEVEELLGERRLQLGLGIEGAEHDGALGDVCAEHVVAGVGREP
jgi:hypothetical protein